MKKYILGILLLSSVTPVFADGHHSAEKKVIANVKAYWDARNDKDFDTVVAMTSKSGILGTNSDGSFHKPLAKQTAAGWAQGGDAITQHFYTEATAIADDVVHVRFYSEGMVGNDGVMSDYRTRVTMNWVKEDGKWVVRSAHYSPASYGGVHKTLSSDFED